MEQEEKRIQWIHRYLNNELSKKEEQVFLQKMNADQAFKKEVKEYQVLGKLATYLNHTNKLKRAINIFKRKREKGHYALEELKTYFVRGPILRTKSRKREAFKQKKASDKIPIVVDAPKDGEDCKSTIHFELHDSIPCTLELIISDHEKTVYQNSRILPNTLSLDIEVAAFSTKHPGLYQWNLKPANRKDGRKYQATDGFFFIQKGLDPFKSDS